MSRVGEAGLGACGRPLSSPVPTRSSLSESGVSSGPPRALGSSGAEDTCPSADTGECPHVGLQWTAQGRAERQTGRRQGRLPPGGPGWRKPVLQAAVLSEPAVHTQQGGMQGSERTASTDAFRCSLGGEPLTGAGRVSVRAARDSR
ncbi:hypothetical protein H920_19682 [Fukomys damarensis]|uniref:Uncharacterized protein n=1 Tax=Fukomys damarensis TaxID=885580 RepID=A0A091CN75_FUKDA|nr:hypothetical protein H920_19682 [Fukomys damarensis]